MNSVAKKILFITGTRADFGKLKPLIQNVDASDIFEIGVFVTGMHTLKRYGYTATEVHQAFLNDDSKDILSKVHVYHNQAHGDSMEIVLSNTISGLSKFVSEFNPDLIVVHGDRLEALAGSIVGSFRNILVAHIEGGEVSGTLDELIRHAVTKLSHFHFVANDESKRRLIQLGEDKKTIDVFGSPDIDIMLSENIPALEIVKRRYDLSFDQYAVVIFHPITTDLKGTQRIVKKLVDALVASKKEYVVIYPNNDSGSEIIFKEYERIQKNHFFRLLPSMRIEYFLSLLKNAQFMIGNSSAGIRECPVYSVPSVNLSTRQHGRQFSKSVKHVDLERSSLDAIIQDLWDKQRKHTQCTLYGNGKSASKFMKAIESQQFWETKIQKYFCDLQQCFAE